jgi:predicted transcriptional regulator
MIYVVDYEKFWNELAEELQELPKQPDEITVKEFAEKINESETEAYRKLERLVKEGRLTKRSKVGRYAYYKPVT